LDKKYQCSRAKPQKEPGYSMDVPGIFLGFSIDELNYTTSPT
jgi:hypothetical protein